MSMLMAFDPGGARGHTGAVLVSYSPDTLPVVTDSWAIANGWEGITEFQMPIVDDYVVERFVNRNLPGADLSVVLTEGAIMYAIVSARGQFPDTQPAAAKNSLVPDKALKELGMWFTGDHHHDRTEAARHALIWLRKRRHKPTLELLLTV